jgi:hypothetical protein
MDTNAYYGLPPRAPRANKPSRFGMSPRLLLFVGLGATLVIISIILIVLSQGPNVGALESRLLTRIATTQTMLERGQNEASSSELRNLSSELSLVLTSDTAAIRASLSGDAKKASKQVVAEEANASGFEDLDESLTNGRFDQTYIRVLSSQLDSLNVLMSELYNSTNITEERQAIKVAYDNLNRYQDKLAALE